MSYLAKSISNCGVLASACLLSSYLLAAPASHSHETPQLTDSHHAAQATHKAVKNKAMPATHVSDGKSPIDKTVSNAFNMKNQLSSNVNPQTGQVSMVYPIASVPGEHGLNIDLTLVYDSSDTSNIEGLGPGWRMKAFPFMVFNDNKGLPQAHLPGGQVYDLLDANLSKPKLKYYTLKNISITNNIMTHQGKQPPTFQGHPYLYKMSFLKSGLSYYFGKRGNGEYQPNVYPLVAIGDNFGNAVIFNKSEDKLTISSTTLLQGKGGKPYIKVINTVSLNYNDGNVKTITLPNSPNSRTIYLNYAMNGGISSIANGNQLTRISYQPCGGDGRYLPETITYPTGLIRHFEVNAQAIPYLANGQTGYLCAISQVYGTVNSYNPKTKRVEPFNTAVIRYTYGADSRYFTGYPDINYVSADSSKDPVLESPPNTTHFTYQTAVIQGNKKVVNTFDNRHLLVSKDIWVGSNGSDWRHFEENQYIYSGQTPTSQLTANGQIQYHYAEPSYQDLVTKYPNYQSPILVRQTFYPLPGSTEKPLIENHTMAYNNYGQLVKETLPNGTIKETVYDTSKGHFDPLPLCTFAIAPVTTGDKKAAAGTDQNYTVHAIGYNVGTETNLPAGVQVTRAKVTYKPYPIAFDPANPPTLTCPALPALHLSKNNKKPAHYNRS